jgi:16S rRNA (guanine966-N2)-methyltransferase
VSLRIISGEFGGRRIRAPSGQGTRPTREAVREAWFSAIGERLPGARVLDLYAGSGALGLEALSRGAATVRFVESNRRARDILRQNLAALGVEERADIVNREALSFVRELPVGEERAWDIALADPPYASGHAPVLVSVFAAAPFVAMLCVEHREGVRFPIVPDWERRYGETALSIFFDPTEGASDG